MPLGSSESELLVRSLQKQAAQGRMSDVCAGSPLVVLFLQVCEVHQRFKHLFVKSRELVVLQVTAHPSGMRQTPQESSSAHSQPKELTAYEPCVSQQRLEGGCALAGLLAASCHHAKVGAQRSVMARRLTVRPTAASRHSVDVQHFHAFKVRKGRLWQCAQWVLPKVTATFIYVNSSSSSSSVSGSAPPPPSTK